MNSSIDVYLKDKEKAKKIINDFFEENWDRIYDIKIGQSIRLQLILS